MNNQTKGTPKFTNEAQGREYWEMHDSNDHVEWSMARKLKLPNLTSNTQPLVQFMQSSPLHGVDELAFERDKSVVRGIDL